MINSSRIISAIHDKPCYPPPIWLMRQAGRHLPEYRELRLKEKNFLDFCLNTELAIEATLQPIRRYSFDAAILFSDILMIPHALGQKVWFEEGEGPRLEPIVGSYSLDRLDLSVLSQRLEPVYKTAAGVRTALPADKTLIGFAGAPWTVACYMIEGKGGQSEFQKSRMVSLTDPSLFASLIDLLEEATITHLLNQIQAGAGIVQIFDSWSGLCDEDGFYKWVIEPTRRIVTAIRQKAPNVPIIGFPRGAGASYIIYSALTGVDVVSLDTNIPIRWAVESFPSAIAIQGNLNPLRLLAGGDSLASAIDGIRTSIGQRRFIFNLGHGIVPTTPPGHVDQLLKRVRQWKDHVGGYVDAL